MTPALIIIVAACAGCLGAVVGIGGGIVLVPFLTLVLHVDMQQAVAASLVGVVATSVGASAPYLRSGLANVRLASFLECGTVCGALVGVALAGLLSGTTLKLVFAVVLFVLAGVTWRGRRAPVTLPEHNWSRVLGLSRKATTDQGETTPSEECYAVARAPLGLGLMFFAGVFSALLGIGAGVFKVLALERVMGVPLRPSTATSSLMMGVTASAGALALLARGQVRDDLAAPVAIGVLVGARLGARLLPRLPLRIVRILFLVVVLAVGLRMLAAGLGFP